MREIDFNSMEDRFFYHRPVSYVESKISSHTIRYGACEQCFQNFIKSTDSLSK
jgi:hypothetical protein